MKPDESKQAWQSQASQTRLAIDAELLLKQVRRDQHDFSAMIFWRDLREVGTSLVMLPLWFYLGIKFDLPWTWYLTVPVLVWIAGCMLADWIRHQRQAPDPSEPLREHVERSLAQVEHQTWLLRNVLWWYLLPLALSMLAFFGQVAWQSRSGGWWTALAVAVMVIVEVWVLAGVYRLNQTAVRSELEPRRQELEDFLLSLKDETPAVSSEPRAEEAREPMIE